MQTSWIGSRFRFGILALCAVCHWPMLAMADEPATHLSFFLRLQAEAVHASGSLPESLDRKGWHLTDGWANGRANAGNWGALFIELGQRINEDLRAVALYTMNLDVDGKVDSDRENYVGLSSQRFGQVVAGRLETPYKVAGMAWDPFNASFLQARGNQGVSFGPFGHGGFFNRALRYSHTLQQVQMAAFVGLDDSADVGSGKTAGNHTYSFSLLAPVGPVSLFLSYIDGSEYRGGPEDRKGTKLGIRYSSGPWAWSARYELRGRGLENGDFFALSASHQAGSWLYAAGYGQFRDDLDAGRNDGEYFMLGARHTLRPGVSVHGGVRRTERAASGNENMLGLGLRVSYNTGNILSR